MKIILADYEEELQPIAAEAARLHESGLYSAQGQFEAAKWWRGVNLVVGTAASAAAAVSGALGLHDPTKATWPAVLALFAAGLGAVLTTLNPSRRMTHAQSSANAYLELQTHSRQLLLVDLKRFGYNEAREVLKELTNTRDQLNKTADPPNRWDRRRAQRQVATGGQSYEIDDQAEGRA